MTTFLPYGRQTIEDDDVAAMAAALREDYLTTGPTVAAFERAFAEATGAQHAVACNSGTAALHLAVLALDIGPGDCAIVPTMTFLATANCVRMTGAEVVFADVDPDTGLMTAETLEQALARAPSGLRPRVALPVHLNGQVCDLEGISEVAKKHGIEIIEDACHTLGETNVGAARWSRAACFSTHPVKAIATGEGGVVTTAEADLAERMRALRSHGMVRGDAMTDRALSFNGSEPNPWSYEMPEIGWNYRMPDLLCALGLSQLAKLPRFIARRRAIAAQYDRLLAPLAPRLRPVPHGNAPHGWHIYAVLIDFAGLAKSRKSVMDSLRADGIGTQVHYIPVHRQPYYRQRYGETALPGADAYYARCLSIPFYPLLTDNDVSHVASAFARVVSR